VEREREEAYHSRADGEDRGAYPGEGDVVADDGYGAADDDGGQGVRNEVGDSADAGAFGCGAFDGLEVEGNCFCQHCRVMRGKTYCNRCGCTGP
jgi:hypothetical protein